MYMIRMEISEAKHEGLPVQDKNSVPGCQPIGKITNSSTKMQLKFTTNMKYPLNQRGQDCRVDNTANV